MVDPALHFSTGRRKWFTPWVWGMWRDRYQSLPPDAYIGWDSQFNFETLAPHYQAKRDRPGMRGQRYEVFPLLSRCNNIGMEGGIHAGLYTPEQMEKIQHLHFWAGAAGTKRQPAVGPVAHDGVGRPVGAVAKEVATAAAVAAVAATAEYAGPEGAAAQGAAAAAASDVLSTSVSLDGVGIGANSKARAAALERAKQLVGFEEWEAAAAAAADGGAKRTRAESVAELCNLVPFGGDTVNTLCKGESESGEGHGIGAGSANKTPLELLADEFLTGLPRDAAGTGAAIQTKEQAQQAQKLAMELYAQAQPLAGARLDYILASFLRQAQALDMANVVEERARKAEAESVA
jgi:hypothetical protein